MNSHVEMCERHPRPWWWWIYQPYKWLVVGPVLAISTLVFGGVAVALPPVLSPRRVGALCGVTPATVAVPAAGFAVGPIAGRQTVYHGPACRSTPGPT
jgi:hypothetical protein